MPGSSTDGGGGHDDDGDGGEREGPPRETVVDGERVPYDVRRSDRATRARIDVAPTGVTVVLPTGSRVDPERVLAANADWLREKRAEMAAYRERAPDREYGAGAVWPVDGEPHEVVVERRRSSVVDEEETVIRLARSHVDRTAGKRALEHCFRETARDRFESQVATLAPRMGVADDVGRVEIRNQSTRWGSCSTTGTVSLNWRLLFAPPAVRRYVVVHELAHFEVRDHSEDFWTVVERFDPAWETHREWLREHAVELVFDESDL
ncbi:SprT family zinc-dependent metalloprotease [Halorubrum gandharaense]